MELEVLAVATIALDRHNCKSLLCNCLPTQAAWDSWQTCEEGVVRFISEMCCMRHNDQCYNEHNVHAELHVLQYKGHET